jgi:pimeloyl-ACP methyl ester carboxylesterase
MARMILLPGLGADERMFAPLKAQGLFFETPQLPIPRGGETMPVYGRRVAKAIGVRPDDLIGGCSFGSVVAAAVARQVPCRGLVLIGGALNGRGLRGFGKGPRWLWTLFPLGLLRPFLRTEKVIDRVFGSEDQAVRTLAFEMIAGVPDEQLLRGGRLLVACDDDAPPLCPVWAIHGDKDRVMVPPQVDSCRIVAGAGHGLVFTHPAEVASFLRSLPGAGAE